MLKRKEIEEVKARYPKGTQIELVKMQGEEQMPPGLKGVVDLVDDIGQVHVQWENGSSLALDTEEDIFHIPKEIQELAGELVQNQQDGPSMSME